LGIEYEDPRGGSNTDVGPVSWQNFRPAHAVYPDPKGSSAVSLLGEAGRCSNHGVSEKKQKEFYKKVD